MKETKSQSERRSFFSERTLKGLAGATLIMLVWLLVWMLVFKFCNEYMLIRNYSNMGNMTVLERLEWDRIPFNYRGTEYEIMQQRITSVQNCFILTPFAVVLQYLINRHRILTGAIVYFLPILSIELKLTRTTENDESVIRETKKRLI